MANIADLLLVVAEKSPVDDVQTVGGFHTLFEIESTVDDIFVPGFKPPSDFPTTTVYQYRKVFWRNQTGHRLAGVQVYGFNVKRTNIAMKMALEKGADGLIKIDGSEIIENYKTAPSLFGAYDYDELFESEAVLVGNAGVMEHGEAQGIWLRQETSRDMVNDPSDVFLLGIIASEVG